MRSKRKNCPLKSSFVPFCQQSVMARMASTTSRILGAGDSNFTEKRRSLWPFTCEPRPRMKRPPEALARSHAMCARIIVLRFRRPQAVVAERLDLARIVWNRFEIVREHADVELHGPHSTPGVQYRRA